MRPASIGEEIILKKLTNILFCIIFRRRNGILKKGVIFMKRFLIVLQAMAALLGFMTSCNLVNGNNNDNIEQYKVVDVPIIQTADLNQ
jgi:hypothetical protein